MTTYILTDLHSKRSTSLHLRDDHQYSTVRIRLLASPAPGSATLRSPLLNALQTAGETINHRVEPFVGSLPNLLDLDPVAGLDDLKVGLTM